MARRMLSEIFIEVEKKVKHADKAAVLQKYASPALFYVIRLAYDPTITWSLPEGVPPYKEHKGFPGSAPSDLMRELRRLYLLLKGTGDHLTQLKREKLFQEMLEGLDPPEAELLRHMKDKTVPVHFRCPSKVIDLAFPGLLEHPFNQKFISR